MAYYTRLARQLLTGPVDEEDIVVIKDLVQGLSVTFTSLNAINVLIDKQIELEASIIYLISKYTSKNEHLSVRLKDSRNALVIGMPDVVFDRKVGRDQRIAFIDSDDSHVELRNQAMEMEVFVATLQLMQKLVFYRAHKLELISTNYRRELSSDEKAD